MEFGKFLAKLRKERGILQKDLAGHLNVTVSTISNYEKGVHYPDLQTLVLIADFFDVSTDYLLQRTDCSMQLSPLNHPFGTKYTIGDLLRFAAAMDNKSRDQLVDYCELLLLRENGQQESSQR